MADTYSTKLSTIQKRNKLNEVYSVGWEGPGGAHHRYLVLPDGENEYEEKLLEIYFQKGPRKEPNSQHGVIDSDLLEIVRDRLKSFQAGEYATSENANALLHIENALMWLNKRVEDRAERNVLGTYDK